VVFPALPRVADAGRIDLALKYARCFVNSLYIKEKGMNILITVASRHGSTHEIAEILAQELRVADHCVDVRNIKEDPSIAIYDAVIIGSAIYMGKWLASAVQFVEDNRVRLGEVPIWLFSSGPLGQENPQPTGDPKQIDALMAITRACEHRVFVGKLDKHSLGVGERLIARAVGAPEGDFRDWAAIRSWAREIAGVLRAQPTFGA
jgi:menaquinone-dependent protoporphyrinogen oxidase